MSIIMFVGAIILACCLFKAAGFWLIMTPTMFVLAMATSSAMCVLFAILCFIAFIASLSISNSNDANNEEVLESIRKSNRREKKIEEEYGIIDFTEL